MNNKAFTLVELIIVISIVGILSAVAMPKVTTAIYKARTSEFPVILHSLKVSQDVYYTINSNYGNAILKSKDGSLDSTLGTNTTSQFFTYTIIPVDLAHWHHASTPSQYGQGYMVGCKVIKSIGQWGVNGIVLYDNSNIKVASPAEPVYKYAPGWVGSSDLNDYNN